MKKLYSSFLLIVTIFVLSGCGGAEQPQSNEQTQQVNTVTNNQTETKLDTNLQEAEIARDEAKQAFEETMAKEPDLANCETITETKLKDICVTDVIISQAISNKDPKLCDQLKSDQDKQRCISKVPAAVK